MNTNQQISLTGTLGGDPRLLHSEGKQPFCVMRVVCNDRRFDQGSGEWVETGANWYTVNAYRQLGKHAAESLRKGERVIVRGRLRIRKWEKDGKSGTNVEIDAESIGHDLMFGTTRFTSAGGSQQARGGDAAGSGTSRPADVAAGGSGEASSNPWGAAASERAPEGFPLAA